MEKELEKNIEVITKDITSYIPHNILEIIGAYTFSLVMALLVFIIGKWVVNKIVDILVLLLAVFLCQISLKGNIQIIDYLWYIHFY